LLLNGLIQPFQQPERAIRFFNTYRDGKRVRDHVDFRTEPASNNVADYGVKKAVENLPQLREKMAAVIDNYLDVQQDILETYVDRGQLRKLSEPTVMKNSKRIPGLKLDHPRQLAVMHALVRFANIAAGSQFYTRDLHRHVAEALGLDTGQYSLGSLRYELSKLRAKGLIQKVERSRRYKLTREGYSICVVFLKLFERIYGPLTAGLLQSVPADTKLQATNVSPMISTNSSTRWASRLLPDAAGTRTKFSLALA